MRAYDCASDPWKIQVDCMIGVGFVALGELLCVQLGGVEFALRGGDSVCAASVKRLPKRSEISEAFVHIGWIKAHQHHDA